MVTHVGIGLPLGDAATGLDRIERDKRRIGGERSGADIIERSIVAVLLDELLSNLRADLERHGQPHRQLVTQVRANLPHADVRLKEVVVERGSREIVSGIREIRATDLCEGRKEIRIRAVQNPTHAVDAIGEHGAAVLRAVDVRRAEEAHVFELERTEFMFAPKLHMPVAIPGAKHVALHVDVGGGDGADLRDAARVARQDPRGARGSDHLVRERARLIVMQHRLVRVVARQAERKLAAW